MVSLVPSSVLRMQTMAAGISLKRRNIDGTGYCRGQNRFLTHRPAPMAALRRNGCVISHRSCPKGCSLQRCKRTRPRNAEVQVPFALFDQQKTSFQSLFSANSSPTGNERKPNALIFQDVRLPLVSPFPYNFLTNYQPFHSSRCTTMA